MARFDFTTGCSTLDHHQKTLDNLRTAQKRTSCMCAVYCSLGGNVFAVSKSNPDVSITFAEGQMVRLVHGAPVCDGSDVLPLGSVVELDFLNSFAEGDTVTVHPFLRAGDETAELVVESVSQREVTCRCLNDATVPDTVKQVAVNFTRGAKRTLINACDEGIIRQFAVPANVDFISFGAIRAASTIHNLKKMLKEWGLTTTRIIAQIDNVHALRDLPNVLKESDVILLARGELGAVVEPEKMFAVQKHVLRMCERVGLPCIVTRLMDSMVLAPRPTRAEATDIANIVLDGADGLLLGLETLEGNFPLKCLETVLAIAREADAVYDYEARYRRQMQQMNVKLAKATDSMPWGLPSTSMDNGARLGGGRESPPPVPRVRANSLTVRLEHFEPQVNLKKEALAAAAVQTAFQIEAKIIVVFSHTGETTRLVAKYHPQCPVLSLSIPTVHGGTLKWHVEGDVEARQQLVLRGVVPALSAGHPILPDERNLLTHQIGATRTDVEALTKAAELGLIRPGELAVFCQLIAGLSTVKVVEFAGIKKPTSKTFSPSDSRSASPGIAMDGVGTAMGHIGTEQNLVQMAASLKLADVASHPSFASLTESGGSFETSAAKNGGASSSVSVSGGAEHFAPL